MNFGKIFFKINYRDYLKIIIYYYLYSRDKTLERRIDFN